MAERAPRRLSFDGLVACLGVEGATDTAVMVAFATHALVPALRPGQTVVLDNLSAHRAARVRHPVEAASCRLLFLPPYWPDLNPIEPAWSELRHLRRGAGARTTKALH